MLLVFVPGTFLRVLTTSIILVQLSQERVGRKKKHRAGPTSSSAVAAAAAAAAEAEAAEDAESTSELLRTQQYACLLYTSPSPRD